MADEYIRRVEAEEAIEEYCCRMCEDYNEIEGGCVSHARQCPHLSGEEILKPVKAADVQPVKRGEWEIFRQKNGKPKLKCTNCHTSFDIRTNDKHTCIYPKFCEECGADMRGDKNE